VCVCVCVCVCARARTYVFVICACIHAYLGVRSCASPYIETKNQCRHTHRSGHDRTHDPIFEVSLLKAEGIACV
jgi:hypothetical protein